MSELNTTILIPDISGFTEFMTNTELAHSTLAINMLMDAMLKAIGDEYEVTEIEGDALLLLKKGASPSKKEIVDTCIRIFNAFHFQRNWMQQYTVCPCAACQALVNLTLKFVAHQGELAEIKVGNFVRQSGTDMIVAHRLLKNSIGKNEYLLVTDKLLRNTPDRSEELEMKWNASADEYGSIGKVEYQFALFDEARKHVPLPDSPNTFYEADNTPYFEVPITANFHDVYMRVMAIPDRFNWVPGLQKVEQDIPHVFIGNTHHCQFDDYTTDVTPLRMTVSPEKIFYAESCAIVEKGIRIVHEFIFEKVDNEHCILKTRFMNAGQVPIPDDFNLALSIRLRKTALKLRELCEGA